MSSVLVDAGAAIVTAGADLSRAGLSPGTTGNVSVRVGEHVVCTPTGADLGALDPSNLSVIAADGSHVSGPRATKETFMHLAMYAADPGVGAIVHTHATRATAVSCLAGLDPVDAIVPLTPYLTMKAGPIAVVDYRAPGDRDIAPLIADASRAGHRGILLANHGTLVGGATVGDAVTATIELEQAAAIMLLTAGREVRRLTDDEVADLRDRYPYRQTG
ncbi:class II aldolase/adducin family protein [Aeromicrobium ginsengisoli]|uniref:Aldolase n=1 Tax=Aeromicrobium ginsengisoli TaxID=363867 RepID=A0A5M4FCU6_9ACTN|nr:class II aldolase/adducin family protein [Aeromicrobium ginsengisoli]KAA1396059.1 aldolase [Aeromicrobium ginsengisoli]